MTSKTYKFSFDSSSCSGCKACQIACKDKNNLSSGLNWRRVFEVCGGEWQKSGNAWYQNLFAYNISIACNHCEKPICVEVCPTRSITKNAEGIVLVNSKTCVGCHYCEWACPYDAPQFTDGKGTMSKCDFCIDEIAIGRSPACTTVCGLRALEFVELDATAEKAEEEIEFYPMPPRDLTEPSLSVNPHRAAKRSIHEPVIISCNRENRT